MNNKKLNNFKSEEKIDNVNVNNLTEVDLEDVDGGKTPLFAKIMTPIVGFGSLLSSAGQGMSAFAMGDGGNSNAVVQQAAPEQPNAQDENEEDQAQQQGAPEQNNAEIQHNPLLERFDINNDEFLHGINKSILKRIAAGETSLDWKKIIQAANETLNGYGDTISDMLSNLGEGFSENDVETYNARMGILNRDIEAFLNPLSFDKESGTLTISSDEAVQQGRPWRDIKNQIKKVIIQNGVTEIKDYAFESCENLVSITIPKSVKTIGFEAFANCYNLSDIIFEDGSNLETISIFAFRSCKSLKSIFIPKSVKTIGDAAFDYCHNLSDIIFEDGSNLETIKQDAFNGCDSLKSITIPKSVKEIGTFTFLNCENLTEVIFENGSNLETIRSTVFMGCNSLKSITIPESVKNIESEAFAYCHNLTEVKFEKIPENIREYIFKECRKLEKIVVPNDTDMSKLPEKLKQYANLMYYESGEKLITQEGNGWSFNEKYGTLIISSDEAMRNNTQWASYKDQLKKVIIQHRVTKISESTFEHCTNLTDVEFEYGSEYRTIEDRAFAWCQNLKSITLSVNVENIKFGAFEGCDNLTEVNFDGESWLKAIGDRAFDGCKNLKSITIPESVKNIKFGAFEKCDNLTEVKFEKIPEKVDEDIFKYCENLRKIIVPDGTNANSLPENLKQYANLMYLESGEKLVK